MTESPEAENSTLVCIEITCQSCIQVHGNSIRWYKQHTLALNGVNPFLLDGIIPEIFPPKPFEITGFWGVKVVVVSPVIKAHGEFLRHSLECRS